MTLPPRVVAFVGDARSVHLHRWADAFSERADVHLVSTQEYTGSNELVTAHRLSDRGLGVRGMAMTALEMRRLLRTLAPDIVHAHYLVGYGQLAWAAGVRPLMLTAWGTDVYEQAAQGRASRFVTRRALRSASLVTADSRDLVDAVLALGARRKRTRLVHFGVDLELFRPGSPEVARERLGIPKDVLVVASIRNISPHYNIDTLVRAIGELVTRAPSRPLHLVLKGYFDEPTYRAEIDRLVSRLALDDHVTWLGALPRRAVPDVINAADVVVSLARTDSAPVSVVEAMACGVRVVASDLPSLREWIRGPADGWLVDPTSVGEVATALEEAFAESADRRRVGVERMRDRVTSEADARRLFEEAWNLYTEFGAS
jgi:glycosyltransferase involved in cell wall biosynthesis